MIHVWGDDDAYNLCAFLLLYFIEFINHKILNLLVCATQLEWWSMLLYSAIGSSKSIFIALHGISVYTISLREGIGIFYLRLIHVLLVIWLFSIFMMWFHRHRDFIFHFPVSSWFFPCYNSIVFQQQSQVRHSSI